MMLKKMHGIAMIVAGLVVGIAALPADAAPTYIATPLGTLGGTAGFGHGINAAGQVTGESYRDYFACSIITGNVCPAYHAVVYANGAVLDLGTFGGHLSSGRAINAGGQVVGSANATADLPRAFLYANGVMTDLGTLGGSESGASSINASGQVTGYSTIADFFTKHAFLYSNGVMQDLGTLGGGYSSAAAINDSGQVTGQAAIAGGQANHAFLYSGGVMHDLGTLGGLSSEGLGINANGQITGSSQIIVAPQCCVRHAFLYSNGVMTDLGALATLGGGYSDSVGFGIDTSGQVVGTSIATDTAAHAFLYADGTMYDLNSLVIGLAGTVLSVAAAINDSGQIVADGCSATLICQAFRLDPLPTAPVTPAKLAAVEFYYAAFDHYFITAIPTEIAALDGGVFPGWVRTGEAFNVYSGPSFDSASVCRFFSTAFAPKSSHFYTADAGECSLVNQNGSWQLEGASVMYIPVPDRAGNCATGTRPVYRLYNNGQGAAPNHRYTTNLAIHSQMLAQGWIAEGYGNDGVIMCAPV